MAAVQEGRPLRRTALRKRAMDGKLATSRFRCVCWRLFLKCLPAERAGWAAAASQWRQRYDSLRAMLAQDHRQRASEGDVNAFNPLNPDDANPWQQYFKDDELKRLIRQDVLRTFPERRLFRREHVQTMMMNILFIYTRQDTELSYKQGMHELLATILWMYHGEMLDFSEGDAAAAEAEIGGDSDGENDEDEAASGGREETERARNRRRMTP